MDVKHLVALEDHEIVAVSLVVAKKEVLAVLRAVFVPILACNFDCWRLGVSVKRVFDLLLLQKIEYNLFSIAHTT